MANVRIVLSLCKSTYPVAVHIVAVIMEATGVRAMVGFGNLLGIVY